MRKRLLSLCLTLALLCALLPPAVFTAEAATGSGICGNDLRWSYHAATATLTISGTGGMYDYDWSNPLPWSAVRASIETVRLPDGITRIGTYAFSVCTALKSVNIPASVAKIGDYAFAYCSALPEVTIADGVGVIGAGVFFHCPALESITIPKSVTYIGKSTFSECSSLAAIRVAADNVSYSSDASGVLFNKKQTAVVQAPNALSGSYRLPAGVTAVDSYAFAGCAKLTGLTLPEGLVSIGSYAFSECTALTSLPLPKSVTAIGEGAFMSCSALTAVTIPDSTVVIAKNTYAYCAGLTGVTVPKGVVTIGESAFEGCLGLKSLTLPGSVDSIGQSAFAYCAGLTSLSLPDGLSSVGRRAFEGCAGLKTVSLGAKLRYVGANAFQGCSSLTAVYIYSHNAVLTAVAEQTTLGEPSKVTLYCYYGTPAAAYAKANGHPLCYLKETGKAGETLTWSYDANTKTLLFTGSGDMYNYNSYSRLAPWSRFSADCEVISLPWQLTRLGVCALMGFGRVGSLTVSQSCTDIGDYALLNVRSVERVSLVNAVRIGQNAMAGCTALKDVYIYKSNCEIVDKAGTGKTLGVPGQTVIHADIGSTAYQYAMRYGYPFLDLKTGLPGGKAGDWLTWTYDPASKKLTVTGTGRMYDYNNYNNPAPWKKYADECTEISLPWTMTSISVCAFLGFSKVPGITIPQNCTTIGDYALQGCSSMVKASFVNAVKIGQNALNVCAGLQDVYVFKDNCEIVDKAGTGKTLGTPGRTVIHANIGSTAYQYALRYGYTFVDLKTGLPSGKAGAGLTWSYDPASKKLTVTGTGRMYDYNNYNNPAPWKKYADECTEISLPWTMTSISVCAFLGFSRVPGITIPQNCTVIGDYALQGCSSMVKASFVNAVKIGQNALHLCSSLRDVYVFKPDCELIDPAGTGRTLGIPGYTVVHAPKNSTAQAYAEKYGYTFAEYNP